jgi:Putative prokaryotic signal transducing protein
MDPKQQSPATPEPRPHEALVDIFGTKEESEALVVKGLLESAGIDSVIVSLEAPQEVLPGVGGVVIRVAAENAEEARRVIEEFSATPEQLAEDDEADDVSGPAA